VLVFGEDVRKTRLFFVDKLVSMGARIILCDPHRVVVSGPTKLYGQHSRARTSAPGWAMVIAALCARGDIEDRRRDQIDKGTNGSTSGWRALGARIDAVES